MIDTHLKNDDQHLSHVIHKRAAHLLGAIVMTVGNNSMHRPHLSQQLTHRLYFSVAISEHITELV